MFDAVFLELLIKQWINNTLQQVRFKSYKLNHKIK